ncbi:hypothetical protein AB4254_11210 [Vibrio breoganii]
MSLIIQCDKYAIALGLQWGNVPTVNTSKHIQTLIDETGHKFGLVKKDNPEQYQVGTTDDKSLSGAHSAAGVLAALEANIIIVQKVDKDLYWLCAIIDHELVVTTDVLLPAEDLLAEYYDLVATFNEDGIEFNYTADEESSELIASTQGEAAGTIAKFSELILSGDISKSTLKNNKIGQLKPIPIAAILLLSTITIIVAGTLYITQKEDNSAQIEQWVEPIRQLDNRPPRKSPEEIERELLEKAYEEEVVWLTSDFKAQDPKHLLESFIMVYQGLPEFIAGWQVTDIRFNSLKPTILEVDLNRTQFGTPITLLEELSGFDALHLRDGGNAATATYILPDIKREERLDDIVEYIKSSKYRDNSLAHDAHYLGLSWQVEHFDTTSRREPIEGIQSRNKKNVSQLQIPARTVRINDYGEASFVNAMLAIIRAKSGLVTNIRMSKSGNKQFNIETIIYGD